jgi:hypothetical protein
MAVPVMDVPPGTVQRTNEGNVDAGRTCPDTRNIMSSNQGLASKIAVSPSKPAVDPRRERRIHVAVPVKVFADSASSDFQTCCTYEISTIGARLVAPLGIKQIGQVILLQRHNRRAKYKATQCDLGSRDQDPAGQGRVSALPRRSSTGLFSVGVGAAIALGQNSFSPKWSARVPFQDEEATLISTFPRMQQLL